MATTPKAKTQPAPSSEVTVRGYTPAGFDFTAVLRETGDIFALIGQLKGFETGLIEQGFSPRMLAAPPAPASAPVKSAPVPAPVRNKEPEAGGDTVFERVWTSEVGTLMFSEIDGKRMGKLKCKTDTQDWTEFGVKVWDEPLALIDLDPAACELKKAYTLPVEAALVLIKRVPGKLHPIPQKVIGWRLPDGEELIHERGA
jgi:hypothetical protein